MARVMETLRDRKFITQLTFAAERAKKKGYQSILDRFQTCPICRESQLAIGRDEAFSAHCDKFSSEDNTCECIAEDHESCETSWELILNSQGRKRSSETTRRLRRSHQN